MWTLRSWSDCAELRDRPGARTATWESREAFPGHDVLLAHIDRQNALLVSDWSPARGETLRRASRRHRPQCQAATASRRLVQPRRGEHLELPMPEPLAAVGNALTTSLRRLLYRLPDPQLLSVTFIGVAWNNVTGSDAADVELSFQPVLWMLSNCHDVRLEPRSVADAFVVTNVSIRVVAARRQPAWAKQQSSVTVNLGGTYKTVSGSSLGSVTLANGNGAVLVSGWPAQ
jgi:hypothetical protein